MDENKNQTEPEQEIVIVEGEDEVKESPAKPVEADEPEEKKKLPKRLVILLAILAGLVIFGGGGLYYYANSWVKRTSEKPVVQVNHPKEETANDVADITWITPEKVGNLGVFNDDQYKDYTLQNIYYKVANTKDGGEVYLVQASMGPGGYYNYRFKKLNGKFSFLKNNSDELYPDPGYLASSVSVDTTTNFPGLIGPKSLALKNGVSFTNGYANTIFGEIKNTEKIENTTYGDFYAEKNTNNGKFKTIVNRNFYLKLADSSTYRYSLDLRFFDKENYQPNVKIGGVQNTTKYNDFIVPGCGSFDSTIISDPTANMSNLSEIGTTGNGQKVYGISNVNSDLAKEIYTIYSELKAGDMVNTSDNSLKNLTIDQYFSLSPKAIFITPDGLGQYLVFVRYEFKGIGGCAKPVIYLYPTKETAVKVKVGADVNVSIPEYKSGWDVLANPNGLITLGKKVYDSLFWEGQGIGTYPEIDYGFVVKQADLIPTINDHLTKLGLNEKEKSDFLDYWIPKLPKDPYVRLSWLTTGQMNRLAPLTIDPRPDTMIRVFLDYEGLAKPIELKTQNLTAVPRKGFTVVEWGGVLR